MRILLAQINPTIADISGNLRQVFTAIAHARQQHANLVVFPEMTLSGYPPGDFLLQPQFIDEIHRALDLVIGKSKGIGVIIGLPRHCDDGEKRLYNSAAIIEDGHLLGFQDKMLLPTYDVFDERRYFQPGTSMPLWRLANADFGVTICEDLWGHSGQLDEAFYPNDPVEELAALHPEFIVNLSASPFSLKHPRQRLIACSAAALTCQCPVMLCNQVGGNDSLIFDGHSVHISSTGVPLQYAHAFAEDFLLVDLGKSYSPTSLCENFTKDIHDALVLGIRDYFHKSGLSHACLGLSGGIDSAVVACLAVEALGKDNVFALLMPSRYSSEGSIVDAELLVKRLEIDSKVLSIENPFQSFLDLLHPSFDGKNLNVTEENLQARLRGMLLMAFSNQYGYVVLNTGNKSEMAMGYCTLYGDMCGGLAVLSDLLKRQVYDVAAWINREKEIIPDNTFVKPPSAELRPNQKDTDAMPDYSVVDRVVEAYVEEGRSVDEIAQELKCPLEVIENLIKRIHTNEYKRRQAPPGLRISDKAFSIGRCFPIVQKRY